MLHYSGDKDGAVPTDGTINWIATMNRTTDQAWAAYYNDEITPKQVAGYYWRLDGLDFATVHGAGHLVPLD